MAGSYKFGSKEEIIMSITIDPKGVVRLSGNKIDVARKGEQGLKGDPGRKGDIPKHEWDGTKIRLENPDKSWGPWVELRGLIGRPGKDGDLGPRGELGDSIKGDKGDSIKGDKGDPGGPGPKGDSIKGEKGDPGEKGGPGDKGDSVKGDKGDPGEEGDSIQGEPGPKGDPGKRGDPGESRQGLPGPQGDKGEPGIPPHDWNVTLDKVARIEAALKQILPPEIEI